IEELAITEEFIEDGGLVLVYFRASSPAGVTLFVQMPYSAGNDFFYSATAIIPAGTLPGITVERGIIIALSSLDNSTPVSDYQDVPDANYDFRYILIPGGININDSELSDAGKYNAKKYDYEKVIEMFNIPD